jgi:hypothetical protein
MIICNWTVPSFSCSFFFSFLISKTIFSCWTAFFEWKILKVNISKFSSFSLRWCTNLVKLSSIQICVLFLWWLNMKCYSKNLTVQRLCCVLLCEVTWAVVGFMLCFVGFGSFFLINPLESKQLARCFRLYAFCVPRDAFTLLMISRLLIKKKKDMGLWVLLIALLYPIQPRLSRFMIFTLLPRKRKKKKTWAVVGFSSCICFIVINLVYICACVTTDLMQLL